MREIASERYQDLTSPSLRERRSRLIEARQGMNAIETEYADLDRREKRNAKRLKRARGWLHWLTGANIERLKASDREIMFERHRLDERTTQLKQDSRIDFDAETFEWHQRVAPHFDRLSKVKRIWDVTHDQGLTHYKSSAGETIQRKPVRLYMGRVPAIHPEMSSFVFGNANGPDIHLFPGLIVISSSRIPSGLALIGFSDCRISAIDRHLQETESIPSDAIVVGHTWQYTNKDGGPDRRFSYNPRIPICRYGELTITSTTGLRETYLVSDLSAVVAFANALQPQAERDNTSQPSPVPSHNTPNRYEGEGERDDLFEDAARVIVRSQQASVSLLQRKLSVDYTRAARIVDQLEEAGIVGPFEGAKLRAVLVNDEASLQAILGTR